jgi:chemotaxis protein CheY-P-specific phosphatase CheC
MALGAAEFIKKPVNKDEVNEILTKYQVPMEKTAASAPIEVQTDVRDGCQEIANVAMGRAADLLARLLNVFVVMPIPNVNTIEMSELRMTIDQIADEDSVSAVCQGFIGAGISGEALLLFNESSAADLASLMNYTGEIDRTAELELFMDVASILISACLNSIADQLDITFSQGHPIVLGHHVKVGDLIQRNAPRWKKTLAIEMGYRFENHKINCDLLLLFTEDSMDELTRLVSYMTD